MRCGQVGDVHVTSSGVHVMQYSAWLDQHTRDEILKNLKAALDASPADAKESAAADGVLPLMLKLCAA